jgi:hypothetical protein
LQNSRVVAKVNRFMGIFPQEAGKVMEGLTPKYDLQSDISDMLKNWKNQC